MGVYHTAAQDLDPAAALAEPAALTTAFEAAYIYLGAGLRKREMMGTELGFRLGSKQLLGKLLQRTLQIRKGNILVHNQTFNLMEGRGMGCVHLVRTEYTSRSDHTDRQLSFLHHTCLAGRSLGTQHDVFIDIEGILLVLGRMSFRNIQFFKIVKVVLDLRSFHHLIAHTYEDTFYLLQGNGVRMTMAYIVLLRRKGYVDNLCLQLLLANQGLHLCLGLFQNLLDFLACLIHQLAYLRSVLRSHILHTLQYAGQFTLFTENGHAGFIQCVQILCFPNLRNGIFPDFLQFFLHCSHLS